MPITGGLPIRLPQGKRSATKPASPPGSHSSCLFPSSLHSHETAGRKSGHLPARPRRAVLLNIALTSAPPHGRTLVRLPCLPWRLSCRAGSCPNAAVSSHPLSDKMSERGQSSLLNLHPLPVLVLSRPRMSFQRQNSTEKSPLDEKDSGSVDVRDNSSSQGSEPALGYAAGSPSKPKLPYSWQLAMIVLTCLCTCTLLPSVPVLCFADQPIPRSRQPLVECEYKLC